MCRNGHSTGWEECHEPSVMCQQLDSRPRRDAAAHDWRRLRLRAPRRSRLTTSSCASGPRWRPTRARSKKSKSTIMVGPSQIDHRPGRVAAGPATGVAARLPRGCATPPTCRPSGSAKQCVGRAPASVALTGSCVLLRTGGHRASLLDRPRVSPVKTPMTRQVRHVLRSRRSARASRLHQGHSGESLAHQCGARAATATHCPGASGAPAQGRPGTRRARSSSHPVAPAGPAAPRGSSPRGSRG